MRATIVIAAHNEGTLLGKTVDSVKQTLGSLEAEIVVVDDASTDGSVQEVQRAHPDLRVEAFPQRLACHAQRTAVPVSPQVTCSSSWTATANQSPRRSNDL